MDTHRAAADISGRAAIEEWLAEKVGQIVGIAPAAVDRTLSFAEYGLTSSDAVGLSGELEELLARRLSETLLYEFPTISQLSAELTGTVLDAPVLDEPAPSYDEDTALCVAGMACRFPGGAETPDLFWRNLISGVDAATDVPLDRWDARRYFDPDPYRPGTSYTTRGGFLDDIAGFDAAFFGISPREAVRMDPQQRLLLEVAWSALEDAGLAADQLRGSRTGVFVGMMASNQYATVLTERGGQRELDDPYLGLGTAPSVMAGRLSYLLDLRGPSLVVDTACSSSLVALHLAMNSIRDGECDRAVVAGVSATLHPDTFRQACKMRMLAPDGRCKTFDAAADGFLLGEGCGAVVVERLADARAAGHQVLAVLRGSAVNQDGTSNGLTAPSRAAQVAVIRQAHRRAGIDAGDVDYVEAHGSGTQLGDAIEIKALTEVFGAARRALYVGAVKTNIGHLTGAAGMAGLIKTILALRERAIPPNLHLRQPNPAIAWDQSPVRLPADTIEWPSAGANPPTAGVSSFGWSGTNAHLVLSAPSEPESLAPQRPERSHVLPLSAHSDDALLTYSRAIADHLRAHPDADPAAVATTMQSGRNAMAHRSSIAFRGAADAAAALDEIGGRVPITQVALTQAAQRGAARLHFLLPGTGDHFPGMGRDVYDSVPEFRDAIDRCAAAAAESLGADLRTALYPAAAPAVSDPFAALRSGAAAPVPELLARIELAHASVFALNYAAARLWQRYGIEPAGLLGYSLGEYSAACLAGVFDVEAALPLVVRRARLIADSAPSAMLTVATSADRIAEYLTATRTLAAVNSPTTVVVAGPEAEIGDLEQLLTADGIASRRIQTTRAVHTPLLRPLRDRLIALFDGIELRAPRIPYVSNVTGDWITAEQARDPRYWAEHMCATVQFADGVRALAGADRGVLLDLGSGQLGSLAAQALSGEVVALPTLRGSTLRDQDDLVVARTLGRIWSAGAPVDWSRAGSGGAMTSLPTYPFEHRRFWPEAGPVEPIHSAGPEVYEPHWVTEAATRTSGHGPYLVFADHGTPGGELAGLLTQALDSADSVTIHPGTEFEATDDGYRLRPGEPDDYARLLDALGQRDLLPRTVVHLWSVTGQASADTGIGTDTGYRTRGYDSLVALAKQLGRRCADGCRILVVTDHAQLVDAEDILHPGKATLTGPALTIGQEYPGLAVRTLDVRTPADDLATALLTETHWPGTASTVALRGRRRLVRRLRRIATETSTTPYVRDRGVYVITGGTGTIGLRAAAHLAAAATEVRLVLLGRTPPRHLDEHKLAAIRAMEADGAQVLVLPCDIGDPASAATAIADTRARFGPIDGVIHAAGVLSPDAFATIDAMTPETAAPHFRAKVDGTRALAEALRGEQPDFVVLLSSMSAVLGGIGFTAYAAANAFQDQFVQSRGLPGGSAWRSACWDTWRGTGHTGADTLDTYSFDAADALATMDRLIVNGPVRAVVSAGRLPDRLADWVSGADPLRHRDPGTGTASDGTPEDYHRRLTKLWQEALGTERVGPHDDFFESGGNSLAGLQLINTIQHEFRTVVPMIALLESPTIAAMAEFLLTEGNKRA
ncbi:SDR family NAD(P)-dependent oxidoreductase [Nocardia sp. NPDC052566]|uniref:SDR family NAD(P)-dependent oxidoreductase n=1 Tax=Nocardia sp. NPDC052566 TaxID=3364330 RepID=UPI0037CB7983